MQQQHEEEVRKQHLAALAAQKELEHTREQLEAEKTTLRQQLANTEKAAYEALAQHQKQPNAAQNDNTTDTQLADALRLEQLLEQTLLLHTQPPTPVATTPEGDNTGHEAPPTTPHECARPPPPTGEAPPLPPPQDAPECSPPLHTLPAATQPAMVQRTDDNDDYVVPPLSQDPLAQPMERQSPQLCLSSPTRQQNNQPTRQTRSTSQAHATKTTQRLQTAHAHNP